MDVELFVHGVPNGEAFWGKDEEERNYFSLFYDHDSDVEKFLIQTRNIGNKRYCYYNYLVYRTSDSQTPNVVGFDGRDGSYFGLSLRLDFYYRDFAQIYRIMGMLYNKHILGSIVKKDKAKLRYFVPDFKSCSSILDKMREEALGLIGKFFKQEHCASLNSFSPTDKVYHKFNLYDCSDEFVLNNMQKNGRIAISPYYDSVKFSNIVAECNRRITESNQQYDARLKAESETGRQKTEQINALLAAEKNRTAQLQNELNSKKQETAKLQSEIVRLTEESNKNKQSRNIAQLISTINGPINDLTAALYKVSPSHRWGGKEEKRKKWYEKPLYYVYAFNIISIVFLVCLSLGNINPVGILGAGHSDAKANGIIDSLTAANKGLVQENDKLTQKIDDLKSLKDSELNIASIERLDISPYSGGALKNGETYTITPILRTGKWSVEGAAIIKTTDNKIEITPQSSSAQDSVKIKFEIDGVGTKIRTAPKQK